MRTLLTCLLVAAVVGAVSTQAAAEPAGRFACAWSYSLYYGLRANYVTSGDSATCAGRLGMLTLSTRLEEWDASMTKWRTVKFQRRTWTNLNARHFTEAAKRCDGGRYRAKFTWLLRSSGRVVSHLALTEGSITAPSGCRRTRK